MNTYSVTSKMFDLLSITEITNLFNGVPPAINSEYFQEYCMDRYPRKSSTLYLALEQYFFDRIQGLSESKQSFARIAFFSSDYFWNDLHNTVNTRESVIIHTEIAGYAHLLKEDLCKISCLFTNWDTEELKNYSKTICHMVDNLVSFLKEYSRYTQHTNHNHDDILIYVTTRHCVASMLIEMLPKLHFIHVWLMGFNKSDRVPQLNQKDHPLLEVINRVDAMYKYHDVTLKKFQKNFAKVVNSVSMLSLV